MYLLKGYHPSDSFFLRVNDVTFECYFCGVLGMRLERLYTSVGHLVFLPSVEERVSCAPASLAQRRSREFLCHNLLNSLTHFSFKYFLTFPYKTFCPFKLLNAFVHVFGDMLLTFCIFSCSYYQPTRETVYSASASRRDAQSTYGRNAYVWMKQLWGISWPNITLQYIDCFYSVQLCKYLYSTKRTGDLWPLRISH